MAICHIITKGDMMYKKAHTLSFDDQYDIRTIVVDITTGNIDYPVLRCMGNYNNHIVVGNTIGTDNDTTYTLFATNNLPFIQFTLSYVKSVDSRKVTNYEVPFILARAKDRLHTFKP